MHERRKEDIELGSNLRKCRIKKNITQTELANKLGISQSSYSNYELGVNQFSTATLLRIADILDVRAEEIINPVENEEVSELYNAVLEMPIEELFEVFNAYHSRDDLDLELEDMFYYADSELLDAFEWAGKGIDIANRVTEEGKDMIENFINSVLSNPMYLKV